MNAQQGHAIRQQFLDLVSLVKSRLPNEVEAAEWDSDLAKYQLYDVDVEDLTAHYRRYIGCGDYEYTSTEINLTSLLEQA